MSNPDIRDDVALLTLGVGSWCDATSTVRDNDCSDQSTAQHSILLQPGNNSQAGYQPNQNTSIYSPPVNAILAWGPGARAQALHPVTAMIFASPYTWLQNLLLPDDASIVSGPLNNMLGYKVLISE